jgi:integrase
MAGERWYKVGVGLQARDHASRKYGRRFDRFIRGRYMVDGKWKVVPFGWESEWVDAQKARMEAEGTPGPRMSFLEHCTIELARLKSNARVGDGPTTIKEDVALKKAKAQAEEEARKEQEQQALTFQEYFEKIYFPGAKVSKKENTCKQEQSFFDTWLKPNLGSLRLIDIRPLHLEGLKRRMVKAGRAPRTIQAVLATARQCWNHARDNEVVTRDWPGRPVKAGRFDNRRLRFLTPDESDRLLAKLKETSQQVHDMALLSLDTGMRAGEVFSLDWEHVDLDGRMIRVVDTKSGKNRVAYMTGRIKTMLEALPDRKGLVFPSNTGECIGQISNTFMRAVDALGLNEGIVDKRNRVTFHTCRHTFASNLVAGGVDLYVVKELMGHSTLALTERYSHLRAENLRAAVKVLEPPHRSGTAKGGCDPLKKIYKRIK